MAAVERLPVLHHSAELYFHFLWDHWAHYGIFENGVLLMYTLEGVSSVANFITAYEESQQTRDSRFLSVMCSLFPKAIFYIFSPSFYCI